MVPFALGRKTVFVKLWCAKGIFIQKCFIKVELINRVINTIRDGGSLDFSKIH